MLAIDAARVKLDRAVPDYGHMLELPKSVFRQPVIFDPDPSSGPDYSAQGARGDPTLATVEKGVRALDAMVAELVAGSPRSTPTSRVSGGDVLVVGYGFAGGMAAIAAADAGARVLILEKNMTPAGISVCSAGGLRVAADEAAAFAYLRATCGGKTPDAVLAALRRRHDAGLEPRVRTLAEAAGATPFPSPFAG